MTDRWTAETEELVARTPMFEEPVTPSENSRRAVPFIREAVAAIKASRTHCHLGHPLGGPNEVVLADGRRACRACQRTRNRVHDDRPQTRRRGPKMAVVEHRGQASLLECGHTIIRDGGSRAKHMLCDQCEIALAGPWVAVSET